MHRVLRLGLENVEAILAIQAAFVVSIGIGFTGWAPLMVMNPRNDDGSMVAILLGTLLLLAPPGIWVMTTARMNLPLQNNFCLMMSRQALRLRTPFRQWWGGVWILDTVICAWLGHFVADWILSAIQNPAPPTSVVVLVTVVVQTAFILGGNLYIMLATAAWFRSEARILAVRRHRFLLDLLLVLPGLYLSLWA